MGDPPFKKYKRTLDEEKTDVRDFVNVGLNVRDRAALDRVRVKFQIGKDSSALKVALYYLDNVAHAMFPGMKCTLQLIKEPRKPKIYPTPDEGM